VILGIQIGITSGCAFYDNNCIVYASSEERFSNVKNDTNFPYKSIQDGMQFLGISENDIQEVVLISQEMTPIHFLIERESKFSISDYYFEQKKYWYPKLYESAKENYLDIFKSKLNLIGSKKDLYENLIKSSYKNYSEIWNQWRINEVSTYLKIASNKISIVNHEQSHAAYAYFASPFRGDDVLIVTCDGFGDKANATISECIDGKIATIATYQNFNVGRVYRYITLLLGMKPSEHEFKVMGLAPYATEYEYKKPYEIFKESYSFNDGEIKFNPNMKDNFFYFKEKLEGCRFDGIAGGLQKFCEDMMCDLTKYWMEKKNKKRVVLSGGVSLNIKANMEVGKLDVVDDMFVAGSGGDESLSIGGIYLNRSNSGFGRNIEPLKSLYLGNNLDPSEVNKVLEKVEKDGKYTFIRDCAESYLAKELSEGKILGRVFGRMEFGARALGNRSILADPRSSETIKKINRKIKNRDFWMPFTPSILDSDASTYLENKKNFQFPFMSIACETKGKAKDKIPATLHPADSTARPQIVSKDTNFEYFNLISCFKEITGVGALLNTSLNLHGYPIARSAEQAYFVFDNSELDGLILDKHYIYRKYV
jgi:carbamoyltransferase